jgi:hypothetical protein
MKPLYATLEDRMFGRAQRDMTDEEKKDMQFYCDGLAKYVCRGEEAMTMTEIESMLCVFR